MFLLTFYSSIIWKEISSSLIIFDSKYLIQNEKQIIIYSAIHYIKLQRANL
jgi:hypothetical protein